MARDDGRALVIGFVFGAACVVVAGEVRRVVGGTVVGATVATGTVVVRGEVCAPPVADAVRGGPALLHAVASDTVASAVRAPANRRYPVRRRCLLTAEL